MSDATAPDPLAARVADAPPPRTDRRLRVPAGVGDLVNRVEGSQARHEVETGETELERCQRNFSELLQELRVAQAGVQILFAFLLTLAFTGRLADSGTFERVTYMVALLSAAASSALLIAPVAQHRMLFRLGRKPYLVRSSHRMASTGLGLLVVSMVASVLLAGGAVLSRPAAVAVAALVGAWFVVWWVVAPWVERGPVGTEETMVSARTQADGAPAGPSG